MVRVLAALAIIVAIPLIIFFSPILKIKNVEFSSNQNCLSNQNQIDKYQLAGKNIIIFNASQLSQNLKNDFSCIDQVKITKAYPATLKIEIAAQEPVVKIEGGNLTASGDGIASQSAIAQNLPTLFLPPDVKVATGQKITDAKVLFALQVAKDLKKTDFEAQNVRIVEGGDVAVYNTQGVIALFSPSKQASVQVDSLQLILAGAKIDGSKIGKIDLRFDKPVISDKENGQR